MKDEFISLESIEADIKIIETEAERLALQLSLLSQKIKYITSKIERCNSMASANEYFDLLQKIQMILCVLVFKHDIGIPERLYNFMQTFENVDYYKEHLFQQIKNKKYSF